MKKVYLAGGAYTDWRIGVTERFKNIFQVYDPMLQSRQGSLMEFTIDDLSALRGCDLVLGVSDYVMQHGMSLEFGFAHALGKQIVYVCQIPRIESMMVAVSKAAFTDLDEAVEYMIKRMT